MYDQQLRSEGYCVIPNVLDDEIIEELIDDLSERVVEQITPFTNSSMDWRPTYMKLYTHPGILHVLQELKCPDPKILSAYFVNKRWGEAREPWHHNWYGWNEPLSRSDLGPEIGLMVFLTPTDAINGALEVLPRSHREWWVDDFTKHEHWFEPHPRGIPVYANSCDIVVIDSRILHTIRANNSRKSRMMCTLWYFTDWMAMTPEFRAFKAVRSNRDGVDRIREEEEFKKLGSLHAKCEMPFNSNYKTRNHPIREDMIV